MCTEIDYLPQMLMISDKDLRLLDEHERRKSWTPSMTSSSSTSTTATAPTSTPSWIDRKLFSHLKRLFRRSPSPPQSISATSSRRPSSLAEDSIASTNPQSKPANDEEQASKADENVISSSPSSSAASAAAADSISEPAGALETPTTTASEPVDSFYDYNHLLSRCLQRQEHDLTEMLTRSQSPVSIPHADLIIGQTRSRLVNWKAYTRLFRALNRDPQLFQQYVDHHYGCRSSINQREQLTFSTRTTRSTFDNVLKSFLDQYVTCLACQKARTNLIKSTGLWRIECQLCGSQRSVPRLRWKRQSNHS